MRSAAAALAATVTLLSACAYHNVIHNAERLFSEGERDRRAGRDSLASARYRDVVRKTGEAFRARPDGEWSCDALVLLGRSYHRLGELRAARASLEAADGPSSPCEARAEVGVYLAGVWLAMGHGERALERVNRALQGTLPREAAAEAHLIRGVILLERSVIEPGWWDLDRAIELEPGVSVAAGLAGLRWSVAHDDRARGRRAIDRLFSLAPAGARADSVVTLTELAGTRWGHREAAQLLAGVDGAAWDRGARGRVALQRARHLQEAGDTAEAREQATRVASGLGDTAAEARLLMAGWRLERARDLPDVTAVRGLLLPAGNDVRVAERLASIDEFERFTDAGLEEPLGLFAAAEIARDRLGANYVARGLLLAYADGAHEEPWTAKALLAALELSTEAGDRTSIRLRLEAYRDSPYVRAALGRTSEGFEALEQELDSRLKDIARQ